jgi:hypothetical protein
VIDIAPPQFAYVISGGLAGGSENKNKNFIKHLTNSRNNLK